MGVDLTWIDKLRVADLKEELDKRNVQYKKSLKKAELAEILTATVAKEVGVLSSLHLCKQEKSSRLEPDACLAASGSVRSSILPIVQHKLVF